MKKKWLIFTKRLVCCAVLFLLILYLCVEFIPFNLRAFTQSKNNASLIVLGHRGEMIDYRCNQKGEIFFPVELKQISAHVKNSTVAAEDHSFYSHHGVDIFAAIRALRQNIFGARRISGASTISMQCIRILEQRPRTYLNKVIETFKAIQLERNLSKQDILEWYLNHAPYGGNKVGIEAASQCYFSKSAFSLSLAEATLLAGLPQSPSRYDPRFHMKKSLKRRSYVLEQMEKLEYITSKNKLKAIREPIEMNIFKRKRSMTQLAEYISRRSRLQAGTLQTYIQAPFQNLLDQEVVSLKRSLLDKPSLGLAILVVDHQSHTITAYCGSSDKKSWFDAVRSHRQPGSTLKPFLYAKAYEQGWLTPDKIIYDEMKTWGSYRPQNMDHQFLGPISAKRGLITSRNIPAVQILEKIGLGPMKDCFSLAGLSFQRAKNMTGLSLALGTSEVSLLELAEAYCVFPNGGEHFPLQLLKGEIFPKKGRRVFSKSSCGLLLESLGADVENPFSHAYKTGTSWGGRDAWAIVMNAKHLVAVWRGNLSGRGEGLVSGAEDSLPLARSLLNKISSMKPPVAWTLPPPSKRIICTLSGFPSGIFCKNTVLASYILGKSHAMRCSPKTHQELTQANQRCYSLKKIDLAQQNLMIEFPRENESYVIDRKEQQMLFKFKQDEEKIAVYLNGEFLKIESDKDFIRWNMQPGTYELIACRLSGTFQKVCFEVMQPF